MKIRNIIIAILAVLQCSIANAQFNPEDPSEPGNQYKLSLKCSPEGAGNVYGSGKYSKGAEVYISAYPKSGYIFSCWKNGDNIISTSSSIDYIMPNVPTTLTAYFEKEDSGDFNPADPNEPNSPGNNGSEDGTYHTLTIIKEPSKGAQLNKEGEIRLREGETVYLYANLSNGYEMDGWYIDDKLQSIQTSYSYTMWNHDDTLTVKFNYNPSDPTDPGSSENKEFILITSQAQLEDYANIEEFPRSVRIMGSDITSLQSLSRMKRINGDLRIENTSLTSLEGLDNLKEITGKLMVLHNRLLTTMEGIYSWDGIYYVLIEGNPELVNYCSMIEYALKGERAYGEIRENGYNPTFEEILNGFCSKNEDIFRVSSCKVTRQLDSLHFALSFSNEPELYSDITPYINVNCSEENLNIISFRKNNLTYDVYTSLPQKANDYQLAVSNVMQDVYGRKLNQNGNSYEGEADDSYSELFPFNLNELQIVNQAPLDGFIGERGYTEVAFNGELEGALRSNDIRLFAPSGSLVTIESVEFIDTVSPKRYRINYSPLTEDGQYEFNVLSSSIKGLNGKDMICDYRSYIDLPCVNFHPQEIIAPDNFISGEKQTISYKVLNAGSKDAIGSISDVVYISNSDSWNSEAVEVYRNSIEVSASSNGEYNNTLEFVVPSNFVDGQYFIILKTNVSQSIKEASYTDNILVSEPIKISVPQLAEDNSQFTLSRGESKLFRLPTIVDSNIEVVDSKGIANMYIGYYSYPDITQSPNRGSATILGSDASINYYLLVSNNAKSSQKAQECELSIRQFALDIPTVGRTEIIKYGTAWIPIEITGCAYLPEIYLQATDGQKYESIEVQAKSETSFYAQFDMSEIPTGRYHIYVDCNGITGLKENAVTVIDGQPTYSISSKLVLPETSRIGSTITAYIDYYNAGNVDAPIPLFILSGQKGSIYELPNNEVYSNEAHILGLNENGVLNTILPGESNRISINITIPNEQINTADYKLRTITEGCKGIDEPFYIQWLGVYPDEKPECFTEDEWSKYVNQITSNVGSSWRSFINAIGQVVNLYYSSDNIEYDANYVYNIIKNINLVSSGTFESRNSIRKQKIPSTLRDVEAGTIFLWKNGQWVQVVNAIYEFYENAPELPIFSGWSLTENSKYVNLYASKNFIISHGWQDDREGKTKDLAIALAANEGNCNIFGIDWSKSATTSSAGLVSLGANIPASRIPNVADKVIDALCTIYGTNKSALRLNNLHLIGHSHGAHVCGMIAHKLNYKPHRLTALDASTQMSHLYSSNLLGMGWNRTDASFIDYYKSSIMAGTNKFKGHNNFILIESNDGFAFEKFSNEESETYRHGYSIDWFAKSIYKKDMNIGYNLIPNYLKSQWGRGYTEEQYHGVINGSNDKIENFSIRNDYDINPNDWNYTEPWYGKKLYQGLFNDNIFQNALASTLDYESLELVPYSDGQDYIKSGTLQRLNVKLSNLADNNSIPLSIRLEAVQPLIANTIFIKNSSTPSSYSISKDKDGQLIVNSESELYILGYNSDYINTTEKESETEIEFTISSSLWDKLAGNAKDEDYIYCDLWLVAACDKEYLLGDWYNSSKSLYYPFSNSDKSYNKIKISKGELYANNNVKIRNSVKIQNPNLACEAGDDMTYELSKGQNEVDVRLYGTVTRNNGRLLSYYWSKLKSVFSTSKESSIKLGVGKHRLTFGIEANDSKSNVKATKSVVSSINGAEDEVIITVKPYTPGDEDDKSTLTASSWDPNEKVGSIGVGENNCVLPNTAIDYTIYFENDAEKATLAAQKVTVYDVLDEAFDLSTFEFTGAEVANTIIDVPEGLSEYSTLTDLRPNNNLLLKTELKLDVDTRTVTAEFSSIDPETGEFTKDVWAGFLPPNDDNHSGEGHFSYRVNLREDVANEYNVTNIADIYFDYNDCISTNQISHFIDTEAPESHVNALVSESNDKVLPLSWTGSDLSGIQYYDIYVSDNGTPYNLWQNHTTDTTADFEGEFGHSYSFYSIATDLLGHIENKKNIPDVTVKFTENGSGITDVISDDVKTSITVNPSIPKANESCTIQVSGLDIYNNLELRIYDVSGRLRSVLKNVQGKMHHSFNQSGIYIICAYSDGNVIDIEPVKVIVN